MVTVEEGEDVFLSSGSLILRRWGLSSVMRFAHDSSLCGGSLGAASADAEGWFVLFQQVGLAALGFILSQPSADSSLC